MTTKSYCVKIDCVGGLKMSDRELRHCLNSDGKTLTPQQCREQFVEWLRSGYDVGPPCESQDSKGLCRGHEIEKAESK